MDLKAGVICLISKVASVLRLIETLIVDVDRATGILRRHKASDSPVDLIRGRTLRSRGRSNILIHKQMVVVVSNSDALLGHRTLDHSLRMLRGCYSFSTISINESIRI